MEGFPEGTVDGKAEMEGCKLGWDEMDGCIEGVGFPGTLIFNVVLSVAIQHFDVVPGMGGSNPLPSH